MKKKTNPKVDSNSHAFEKHSFNYKLRKENCIVVIHNIFDHDGMNMDIKAKHWSRV